MDFDEVENKNSSDVPIVTGTGQGGSQNRSGKEEGGRDIDITTNTNSGGNSGNGKSGPKIHGVRVTVDTGDTRRSKGKLIYIIH